MDKLNYSKVATMMAFLASMGYAGGLGGFDLPKDRLRGIDIEKEAELIKQKKSRLSSNERRMVMLRYENGENHG